MNVIGVEPRLSLLEAEVDELEAGGGGGGESLWEEDGQYDIRPKNSKWVQVGTGSTNVSIISGGVTAFGSGTGNRQLRSGAYEGGEHVPSFKDFDGNDFQLDATAKKIQVKERNLWEVFDNDYISPKNGKGLFLLDVEKSVSIVGDSIFVEDLLGTEPSRRIDAKPLTEDSGQVISVRDLSETDFQIKDGFLQLKIVPRLYIPIETEGDVDVTALIGMTPTEYEPRNGTLYLWFDESIKKSPWAQKIEYQPFTKVKFWLTITWTDSEGGQVTNVENWTMDNPLPDCEFQYHLMNPNFEPSINIWSDTAMRTITNGSGFRITSVGATAVY